MAGRDLSAELFTDSLLSNKGRDLSADLFPEEKQTLAQEVKGGLASAPINLYLGAKQFAGGLSPVEQDVLRQNKAAEKRAPISSALSNIGTLAPAMLVPGANTVAGAALTNGITGALQPVEGEQSLRNIAQGKLLNTGIGTVTGAGGQKLANWGGQVLQGNLANAQAEAAKKASQNSMRDTVLANSQDAGYTIPRSMYDPTFLSNRLESLAGKAATKQEAASRNQEVTNTLARKALGVPEDQPISIGTLEGIRKTASQPYQEIAALSPVAKADLEALKQARNDAQGWFNAYNRSASPADLAKAKEFRATADQLEQNLEGYAKAAGRDDLLPALVDARKQIAKSYTVERALNRSTGDVSAPVLGRLSEKGKPLSDGLETIGQFNAAFPQVSQAGAKIPAPGVSKSEALASGLLGVAVSAATGSPLGLSAALLPMLSHPARALALSKAMQSTPSYGVGLGTQALGQLDPTKLGLLLRGLSQYETPALGGLLAGQ